MCVWIVLRVNKPNTPRNVPQKVQSSLRLSIQTFVGLFMILHLLVKKKYVITFIDDFSRYDYIYLLHEKSKALNVLEVYITEVERQLKRKVKIIRSDRGGEYYVQAHLLNSLKSMAFVHNTLCQKHHSKMV